MYKIILLVFFLFINTPRALEVKEVVRVIDGDTIVVNLKCDIDIFCKEIRVRLLGIDTPEIRSKNKREKWLALKARDYLEGLIEESSYIEIKYPIRGKYFRIVGDVRIDGVSASQIMISEGYAKVYEAGGR